MVAASAMLTVDALTQETAMLRRRHDDLTSECQQCRQRLANLVERTNSFIPTSELDAGKDEDAAEIAGLEDELDEVEYAIAVANHERQTYGLMIERIAAEAKTYKRDMETIDMHKSAKSSDAEQLQLHEEFLEEHVFKEGISKLLLGKMVSELAILGFVSFTATVIMQFLELHEETKLTFEYSHVLMFVTAVLRVATSPVSRATADVP